MSATDVVGTYRDGKPIHKHPTEQEILDHWDEWVAILEREKCVEQLEVLNEIRDSKIQEYFFQKSRKMTVEQAIDFAIRLWVDQYPNDVLHFRRYIQTLRTALTDPRGFSTDRHKLQLFQGSMPVRIKGMLLRYSPDFFERDQHGHSKNLTLFYRRFTGGRVGTPAPKPVTVPK